MSTIKQDEDKPRESRNKVLMFEIGPPKTDNEEETEKKKKSHTHRLLLLRHLPNCMEIKQYIGVCICGLTIWGASWFILNDLVIPGGYIFNMTSIVIIGYIFGHMLERYTTINPVVGMTFIGAVYRTFTRTNFLENPTASAIDFHLRRIYPAIILTKGPLSWDWNYIKNNPVKVFSLATVPWTVECLSIVLFAHVFLGYPWYWGLHLGSILASVSPAVVVPTTLKHKARGLGIRNKIAELVGNAGGLDTAFTEGLFGVINSAIFYPSPPVYRIIKAPVAILAGIILGIIWGVLADTLPDHNDLYAPTIRSIFILGGGVFITYGGGYLGWGGMSGVAIMVCAAAAGTRWARRGWPINNNPVSEIYKLLWRIFEPMLFVLSGYFLEVSEISAEEFGLIVAFIFSTLALRLFTAFLIAVASELSVRESIFIAITWIPKAIVEAVLVRVATDSLWVDGSTAQDKKIAKQHSNIIIIAILLTSTLGSVLTTVMGPVLLSPDTRVAPESIYTIETSTPHSPNSRTNNLPYIDGQ